MNKEYSEADEILRDVAGKLESIVEDEDKTIDITYWKPLVLDDLILMLVKAKSLMAIAERVNKFERSP